jgi:hypothetical protein
MKCSALYVFMFAFVFTVRFANRVRGRGVVAVSLDATLDPPSCARRSYGRSSRAR